MVRLLQKVSGQQLRADAGRTLLVIGGIAVGVALIAAINIINRSVLVNFRQTIETIAGPADLQVTLGVGEVGFKEEVEDTVRSNSNVAIAVPLVQGTVTLADDATQVLQLFGADLVAEEDLKRYQVTLTTARRDASGALVHPKSIFLTLGFARRHDLHVGDSVRLATPIGYQSLTVRGLLKTEGFASAFGGQVAVMDIAAAQEILDKQNLIDRIDIVLRDRSTLDLVRQELNASLPDVLTVQSPRHHGMQYDRVLSSFQAMLTGLSSLCLIAGLFIVYNTTSTAAIHRATTMASLRLIGADRTQVLRLLRYEALILGTIGAFLGIAIAVPLAWLLSGTITASMGVIFQLRFPLDEFTAHPGELALIAATGVAVTLFASSFAARRIARLDPLDMIRGGRTAVESAPEPRPLVILWVGLIAASAVCFAIEAEQKSIAWGNFGSTLWNASVVVIAIPLMRWLAKPVSRILPRWFGAEGQVAAGSLFRAEARSGVTVAAIALILTVAVLLSSLVLSCRVSLANYFAGLMSSDLTVSAVSTEGGWLETPLSGELAAALEKVAGVRRVETARALPGQAYEGDRIALLALSPSLFDHQRVPDGWYREGDPLDAAAQLQSGEAVTVSTSFSDRFGFHVGDLIRLESPTGYVKLPIVGVVPDYVSDRGSVIMSREILAKHWHDTSVNRLLVSIAANQSTAKVREAIQADVGDRYRLKVLSTRELLEYHTNQIDRAFAVMNSVQLLVIIVTIAGIFDLLLSRILERRHELALWQVVGASREAVRKSIVLESATLGVVGAFLGVAAGVITAWVWVAIHFRELLGYYVEYHFAAGAMLWYVTLVITVTIVAGYAAASRAIGQPILDGIRSE